MTVANCVYLGKWNLLIVVAQELHKVNVKHTVQ